MNFTPIQSNSPECPKCGRRMVTRTNKSTLQDFWGCSGFPDCRGTRPKQQPAEPLEKLVLEPRPIGPSDLATDMDTALARFLDKMRSPKYAKLRSDWLKKQRKAKLAQSKDKEVLMGS